ncbi:MAG: SDR family oxidoreductase [Candidatus Kariarchaeaceae archaeon]|jgi:NAD(P)-dependent dehydrogenase (short-subunit alcohol dehydrogenase family)
MRNILITGGSKGLGLEFTKQYLENGDKVISTSRQASNSKELQELKVKYRDLLIIKNLDVSAEESRHQLFKETSEEIEKLDILINNAGIKSGNEKSRYKFGELDQEDLCRSYLVNSVSPLMIAEKFSRLMKGGEKPIIVNITSINGCISKKNRIGGWGYSASKAALNMITKMLSVELKDKRFIVVTIHPGWVKTPMTIDEDAPMEPEESINGMIKVIASLENQDNGKFLDWKGNEIPW